MSSPTSSTVSLRAALTEAELHPLWEKIIGEPRKSESAHHWKWGDLLPLIRRVADEVSIKDADRRVLLLANPHYRPSIQTTSNLTAAVQILESGDRAPEHRHTPAAIRVIVEAQGGWTSVDGNSVEMSPGDFILTPSMTWHGHVNDTSSRVIWIDGLDSPFVRFLDSEYFEHHASAHHIPNHAPGWVATGLAPFGEVLTPPQVSSQIHYPWRTTDKVLSRTAPGQDGSVTLRYVNPQNGGAVMPTLDCYVQRLFHGRMTEVRRATSNAVCFVISGEGTSRVGAMTISWKERDIFTIPHWNWFAHESLSSSADLFFLTDRELFHRLGLLREESTLAFPTEDFSDESKIRLISSDKVLTKKNELYRVDI